MYDNKGNLTTKKNSSGTNIFTASSYTHKNLPLTVWETSAGTTNYKYDDSGNRIYKENGSLKDYYFRDQSGREIALYDLNTGNIKQVNIFGNGLVGYVKKGTEDERFYYVKDHLGSVRLTIDENSDIVSAKDYFAFGDILRSVNYGEEDKYDYTEKERDTETGLNYFGARYYDSDIGRWTSVDPLADKYPGWSPYNYTLCNPLLYLDPNGMDVYFYNSDSSTIATIVTGTDDHQHVYTGLDYTTDNPLTINLNDFTNLSSIDAIGISISGSSTFVGGMNVGKEIVYFMSGKNKGEAHLYSTVGGNLGLDFGAGFSVFAASYLGSEGASASSWNGFTNSVSLSSQLGGASYFWSNTEGKASLWPGMYNRRLQWEGKSIGGAFSGRVYFGAKWSATKYSHDRRVFK